MPEVNEPWELWSDDVYSRYEDYGDTVSDVKVYWWSGDDTNYSRWGSHQTLSCTPGDGYDDEIYDADSIHDWSYYGGSGLDIVDRQPADGSSNEENSIGLSISYSGVSINWTYSQGGDVDRTLDVNRDNIAYSWYWDDFDNGEDSSTFETGTEIAADTSPGLQDTLYKQDTEVGYYGDDGTMGYHDFAQYIDMDD
ncbi:hypothetical protein [Halorussus salinisoli]|uniref:hypothetical protein n=1 Tax=Halorussus salinisoli TaxID=2558242 RepID=UPI0010C1BFCF|nr:hypothetical protein [Halorussus salinisoli]